MLHHLKDEHELDFDSKKWNLNYKVKPTRKDESARYEGAHMFTIGLDGLVFLTDVSRYEDFFRIGVRVLGGKQVAMKYRVQLSVSSNKSSGSLTHSGPVFPIEYPLLDAINDKDSFEISVSKFASFNHGMEYFGDHNKDKNGEIVLPLPVKIEKKKLDIPAN